ncbi:allantoin permease [Carnobacterium antarcticum]|uniref:Allantoin permease n=1 Tax=Carnobacterium antarcticum TaxID=2126436 RepID=A0ABW4NQW6_9LACT|nr:putative allantoin permease [Carnobacterium sp. CP1]ALV21428.1 Allantoin permease [Carnobacterium sp. CP1]
MENIRKKELTAYQERGYKEDLLPKTKEKRTWSTFNYFTIWMGSVHNVPNYVAVGGFLALGLSPINVMLAIVVSALVVAGIMILNGAAGSKYGIPFSMILKASYGIRGALFPGFLRGCVAAIMWYGLQTYTGSQALLILIAKIWPGFLDIGANVKFFGISLPGLIAFALFWVVNLYIGLGGGDVLKKFTAVLNPLIYIVFGGMTIWALNVGGGLANVLKYRPEGFNNSGTSLLAFLVIINAVVAVWAAPAVSASDFTQNAKSFKSQAVGQFSGLLVSYIVFAFTSVIILAGASVYYGNDTWNVLDIVNSWDSLPAIALATIVLLMTTISTNAAGNIVPAGFQIAALFPSKINYKQGVVIASIVSFLLMPWKLMENQTSIYAFLDIIGGILGPVIGIMLAHYFVIMKQDINLAQLYPEKGDYSYYKGGFNIFAFVVTIIASFLAFSGKFIPALSALANLTWIVGVIAAFILYIIGMSFYRKANPKFDEMNADTDAI